MEGKLKQKNRSIKPTILLFLDYWIQVGERGRIKNKGILTVPKAGKKWFDGLTTSKFMSGQNREDIKPGLEVDVVLKEDQRSGKLTHGIVADILTSSQFHPHGIKVRLESGEVGRVQNIIPLGE